MKSGVADAFLAAISSNNDASPKAASKNFAIVDFPSTEFHATTDAVSLAAPSVSGDDFTTLSPKRKILPRTERFASFSRTTGQTQSSSQEVEKLVDEKVQAQLRLEMGNLEKMIEEACNGRISALEKKMEEMQSMLTSLMA